MQNKIYQSPKAKQNLIKSKYNLRSVEKLRSAEAILIGKVPNKNKSFLIMGKKTISHSSMTLNTS